MDSSNRHVEQFLQSYLSQEQPPKFAVLVSGQWGSGKTYLIKNLLEARDEPHLFCSLYGVTTTSQIEDIFFQQLHPLLSSKGAKLAGNLLRGALAATLRFDIVNSDSADAQVDVKLPSSKFLQEFSNYSGRTLVFDDLERCAMPVGETLGYINKFCEHDDFRVIIIANEDEVLKSDEKSNETASYRRMKEKLIGQTLSVSAEVSSAFDDFIGGVNLNDIRNLLQKNKSRIVSCFAETGTHNLRTLSQVIWHFERLFPQLKSNQNFQDDGVIEFLLRYLVFTSEVRSGILSKDDFLDIFVAKYGSTTGKAFSPGVQEFHKKYLSFDTDDLMLSPSQWTELVFQGTPLTLEQIQTLEENQFFAPRASENPVKTLWFSFERTETEVSSAYAEVMRQLNDCEITEPIEILHLAGTLLWLSDEGRIREDRSWVVKLLGDYIENLSAQELLLGADAYEPEEIRETFGGWNGMGFRESSTAEFKFILDKLNDQMRACAALKRPSLASKILGDLLRSPSETCSELCHIGDSRARYASTPVFDLIKPKELIDVMMKLEPADTTHLFRCMRRRYEGSRLTNELKPELSWLRELRAEMNDRTSPKNNHSHWRIKYLFEYNLLPPLQEAESAIALGAP